MRSRHPSVRCWPYGAQISQLKLPMIFLMGIRPRVHAVFCRPEHEIRQGHSCMSVSSPRILRPRVYLPRVFWPCRGRWMRKYVATLVVSRMQATVQALLHHTMHHLIPKDKDGRCPQVQIRTMYVNTPPPPRISSDCDRWRRYKGGGRINAACLPGRGRHYIN